MLFLRCGFSRTLCVVSWYASQVWSTQVLEHVNVFSNPLQVAHMAYKKRVSFYFANCVLRECAQKPLRTFSEWLELHCFISEGSQ